MAGDWRTIPFDEAVQINPAVPLERGGIYPFVDMQAVQPPSRDVRPSGHRAFSGGGSRFRTGDTLMARITPCLENGKIARFHNPDGQSVGHGSTEFIVIRGKEGVTEDNFAYYLTRSEIVRGYAISQMTGSSGRQRVPVETLSHLRLAVPPLSEQRAIARILGTLDDKIELNRRMNETLEAMARAIFKSWFVDATTSRLPKGWREGTVGEDFKITMGQSPPGETYNEIGKGLPFFQGRADFNFRFPALRVYSTAPTRIANPGDTLVCVRAPVGDVNMAVQQCCVGRGLAAVRHKTGSRSYTYYAMQALREDFDRFEAEGTVFGSMGKKDFHAISHVVPPEEKVKDFETLVNPIDQMIENNENESRALAAIRDALLPKLLSGEIRIKVPVANGCHEVRED